jgi:ferrous iron transport protein A
MKTLLKSTPMPDPHKPVSHHLAMLHKGESAIVTGLMPVDDEEDHVIQMRLLELGFAPGEAVRVIAESFPGRDPLAVRIGNTTFALRRREASMIRIAKDKVRTQS